MAEARHAHLGDDLSHQLLGYVALRDRGLEGEGGVRKDGGEGEHLGLRDLEARGAAEDQPLALEVVEGDVVPLHHVLLDQGEVALGAFLLLDVEELLDFYREVDVLRGFGLREPDGLSATLLVVVAGEGLQIHEEGDHRNENTVVDGGQVCRLARPGELQARVEPHIERSGSTSIVRLRDEGLAVAWVEGRGGGLAGREMLGGDRVLGSKHIWGRWHALSRLHLWFVRKNGWLRRQVEAARETHGGFGEEVEWLGTLLG